MSRMSSSGRSFAATASAPPSFKYLARKAVAENCGRMEWSVLDWNEPAIRFYAGLGAKPMDAWTIQRLTGDALRNFAESPDHA